MLSSQDCNLGKSGLSVVKSGIEFWRVRLRVVKSGNGILASQDWVLSSKDWNLDRSGLSVVKSGLDSWQVRIECW